MARDLFKRIKHSRQIKMMKTVDGKEYTVIFDKLKKDKWVSKDGIVYDGFTVYMLLLFNQADKDTTIKFKGFHSSFYHQYLKQQKIKKGSPTVTYEYGNWWMLHDKEGG